MDLSGKFEKGTFAYLDCPEDELCASPELSCTNFSLTGDIIELLHSHYSTKHGDGCIDIPLEAVLLHRYHYEDDYGRTVIFGCAEAEQELSQCRSSYVSKCESGSLCIGRLVFLFKHTFVGVTSVLAYITLIVFRLSVMQCAP
jgi:hypothetical protein